MDVSISASPSLISLLLGLGLFALTVALQAAALRWLEPQRPIGDERGYIAMAKGLPDHGLWLRVPLGAAPVWIARQLGATAMVRTARLIVSLCAASVVGLGTWYASEQAGPAAGMTAGLVLLMSAERAVLALHLWPDTLMGLCLLLFAIAISAPVSAGMMLWIGVLAAVGFLIRVDFALLAGFATVMALLAMPVSGGAVALVALPTVRAAAGMTLYNGRMHGIWAPDTTLQFNLAVAATESDFPKATTDELMRWTAERVTASTEPAERTRGTLFAVPVLAFRRVITLLGTETFVTQKLTTARPALYAADLTSIAARLGMANMRVWFSAVFTAFVLFSPAIPSEILWLVGCVVFVQSAVQTRSRYRQSVFPVLAVHGAIAAWSGEAITAGAVALAVIVGVTLIASQPRPEA